MSDVCPRCLGTGKAPTEPGEELKALRIAAGLTQVEVAKLIGTSQGFVSQVEAGKRSVFEKVAIVYRGL